MVFNPQYGIEKASQFTVPGCFFLLLFLSISPDHHICPHIYQACPQCPRSRSYYPRESRKLCMYKIYDFSSSISSIFPVLSLIFCSFTHIYDHQFSYYFFLIKFQDIPVFKLYIINQLICHSYSRAFLYMFNVSISI